LIFSKTRISNGLNNYKKIIIIGLIVILLSTSISNGLKIKKTNEITLEKNQDFEPIDSGFIQWEKTFNTVSDLSENLHDEGHCVKQTSDGGYIIVGDGNAFDVWVIKTDENGEKEWERFFDKCFDDRGYCVIEEQDGYVVLGTYDCKEVIWVIKIDKNGNMLWEKSHTPKPICSAQFIEKTNDGGYIITGWGSYYNWLNCYDVLLLKIDSEGNEQWNKTVDSPFYSKSYSVAQTPDDGYILTGGTCDTYDGESDLWLIKTDSNGNFEWDKTFGDDETWNMGRTVAITSDNNIIVGGEQILIKTDLEGNLIWQKNIGSLKLQETSDCGFVLTGYKETRFKDRELKIVKIDKDGDIEWEKTYGQGYRDEGHYIQQTKDGGYIIIGFITHPVNPPYALYDVWLIKTGEKPESQNIGFNF